MVNAMEIVVLYDIIPSMGRLFNFLKYYILYSLPCGYSVSYD
jgi:hypothetical protein